MPCRCDGYEPSKSTLQAIQITNLLHYVLPLLDADIPEWLADLKRDAPAPYAHVSQEICDQLASKLCAVCRAMPPEQQSKFIYDGRNADARRLADWWDAHQAADAARVTKEATEIKRRTTIVSALSKLTEEERAALGLKPHHL